MTERGLRRALLGVAPPDEVGAQRRAWRLVWAAFDERVPMPWRRRHARPLLAAAAVVALLAAILSPTGRAVIDEVREAVGSERVVGVPQARPALFSLPTQGRVLVAAPTGAWVLAADGSKRRLGAYGAASWSPRGLHVVVTDRNELTAVTPRGEVRWSLARPLVRHARWSPSGFRIAYLSGSNLRVVAGDKTGDRRIDAAEPTPPAWRPGEQHVVAYAAPGGDVTVVDTDARRSLWTGQLPARPRLLEWSADGARLLAAPQVDAGFAVAVFDRSGRRRQFLTFDGELADVAFAPRGHRFALVRRIGPRSELLVVEADTLRRQRTIFTGAGRFSDVAWSPGGRWLLLGWQSADQWLFIRSTDVAKIKAVSSLRKQFDPGGTGAGFFPRIEGWCCPEAPQ